MSGGRALSRARPSCPVALLVLLAAPAPARVVAADRVVLVDPTLLHDRDGLLVLGAGARVAGLGRADEPAGRGGAQRARLLGSDAAGVGDVPGGGPRAAGRARHRATLAPAV